MENEKIIVTIDNYNDFIANLKSKYDAELREVEKQFAEQMLLECHEWHQRHTISKFES